jgi:hypothetical protein
MRTALQQGVIAIFVIAAAVSAPGQSSPAVPAEPQDQTQVSPILPVPPQTDASIEPSPDSPGVRELLDFKDSDVKFDLADLMDILRDRRHEGWVLAAYPDPKTGRPLIGAGFSLDLPAREHPQRDPLNTHPFIEPSSAQLWQTAGLDSERLQVILEQYDNHLAAWSKKKFRKKISELAPQITDEEADQLLRVAIIQAAYNAKAYCRNFDQYTASQQMALTQLVYQMGVNLEEFSQFRNLINSDSGALPELNNSSSADAEYWKAVQSSLIQSQWARLYRLRAVAVIAMLDPQYSEAPTVAEHRVGAVLRPAVFHRRRGRIVGSLQGASFRGHHASGHSNKSGHKRKSHAQGE